MRNVTFTSLVCGAILLSAFGPRAWCAGDSVTYKRVGDRELKIFIDKPTGWKAGAGLPAVVYFFGGGWVGGNPGQFMPQSEYLATRGVVGLRVEYRVIPKGDSGPPTLCVNDAKS